MISGIWGKKIGMTQVFSGDQAVPVTVVDVGNWVVTGFKTKERDGYNAVQIGCIKKRYSNETPSSVWMKKLKTYFSYIREIPVDEIPNIKIGQAVDFYNQLEAGHKVDVVGITRGKGFQGVIKRHDFNGPPDSHGAKMGRRPGSIGHMKASGFVMKGKKMPGHMGAVRRSVKNLDVIEVRQDGPIVLVKGAVPGHPGSLIYLRRHKVA